MLTDGRTTDDRKAMSPPPAIDGGIQYGICMPPKSPQMRRRFIILFYRDIVIHYCCRYLEGEGLVMMRPVLFSNLLSFRFYVMCV